MVEQAGLKKSFLKLVGALENFEFDDPLVAQVGQKLDQMGIKGVLWDLDDHFLATTEYIQGYLREFVEAVVIKTSHNYDEIRAMMKKYSDAAFQTYHVNPIRWRYVIEMMARELRCEADLLSEAHDELMTMYENSPELFPGALTTMGLAKKLGLHIVWVTNANVRWTLAKFDKHDLWRYANNLVIADENVAKNISHWWAGISLSQLTVQQLLGGGDSREGDFAPLKQIGVRGIIGVPPRFEMAKNGHQPAGVTMIGGIAQWPEGVLRLR